VRDYVPEPTKTTGKIVVYLNPLVNNFTLRASAPE